MKMINDNILMEGYLFNESIQLKNIFNKNVDLSKQKKKMDSYKKILKDNAINIEKFTKDLCKRNYGKAVEIGNDFRNLNKFDKQSIENLTTKTSKNISDIIADVIESMANFIDDNILMQLEDNKLLKDIILVCMISTVNDVFRFIFIVLFQSILTIKNGNEGTYLNNTNMAQGLATILCSVMIAPITEETGKFISEKYINEGDKISSYNIVFNAFEMSLYVMKMVKMGKSIPFAIGVRIPAVLMHTANTALIKLGIKKESKDKEYRNKMFILTMIIHSIFNATASGIEIYVNTHK